MENCRTRHWPRPAAARRGDRVFHDDRELLLYYGNRLNAYDLRA